MVDVVLPPRCPISGEVVSSQGMVAPESFGSLQFIAAPFCVCCGFPFGFDGASHHDKKCAACLQKQPPYISARAALVYDDVSRDLILRFKHGDQLDMVGCFTPWLRRSGAEQIARADYIIPVPLHRGRLIRRRYNQASVIAIALAKACGKEFCSDILRRHRATPTQGYLNYKERKKNVSAAFTVNEAQKTNIAGKTILLIDDVYTTGSTVKECTRVLLKAGAAGVDVLSVARVVRPHHDF